MAKFGEYLYAVLAMVVHLWDGGVPTYFIGDVSPCQFLVMKI